MKICVYAFANTGYFFERLIEASRMRDERVEWSAVLPRWHHRRRFERLLSTEKTVYLYENFDALYESVNVQDVFDFSSGSDNELLCLLKDKAGYRFLDGEEQLRRAAAIVRVYRSFLERERPDYIIFPDIEVVDGFLLLALCKSMGITPIYYVGMRAMGGGFFSADCYEKLPAYFGPASPENHDEAGKFLKNFFSNATLKPIKSDEKSQPEVPQRSFWKRVMPALWMYARHERRYVGEDGWVNRIKANVAGYLNAYRGWHFSKFQIRWFHLGDDSATLPSQYILYALQYTPESSINGLEPYYVDQMRAIDLLLMGMPSDYRLVVKEHPAIVGVRANSFYRHLRSKPGVLLAAPGVTTRRLMNHAALIASVTGTIGFESYLLGKPCLLFGRNFFSHLCTPAEGPLSIKRVMADLIENFQVPDEPTRVTELARLFNVRYPISLSDPLYAPQELSKNNVHAFLSALNDHIDRLAKAGPNKKTDSCAY